MASERVEANSIEANQIVGLAFQPTSDTESKDVKVIRRILRKKIESLLDRNSESNLQDLDQIANDLDEIADQLQVKISKDEARVHELKEELKELVTLLERESSEEKEAQLDWIKEGALIAVASTAVLGGLFSGVSGAIVGAAAVPFFLKVAEAIRDQSSRLKRASK
jgi:uncharacterized protein (DUF3084 family)